MNHSASIDPRTLASSELVASGFCRLTPDQFLDCARISAGDAQAWRASWDRLPEDAWMRDGGRYRRRRHSCFVHDRSAGSIDAVAHRAHWQPVDYNALHGGIERMFEPIDEAVRTDRAWLRMLCALGDLFADTARARPASADATRSTASDTDSRGADTTSPACAQPPADLRWFIEAHQFRIDTSGGLGRPTPEGAHRDGVDFVAVILARRRHVRGGETRVFDADGPQGLRFTLHEPWSAVLLDDQRVIHETTPIRPDGMVAGRDTYRDTLVLTYRRGGFQSPDEAGAARSWSGDGFEGCGGLVQAQAFVRSDGRRISDDQQHGGGP